MNSIQRLISHRTRAGGPSAVPEHVAVLEGRVHRRTKVDRQESGHGREARDNRLQLLVGLALLVVEPHVVYGFELGLADDGEALRSQVRLRDSGRYGLDVQFTVLSEERR